MRFVFLLSLLLLPGFSALSQTGDELYRPEFHYSPEKNWLNDPNGLVYYAGEYHLFYQYNPFGSGWGHMSWGHAKSKDLIHWEHLPVAIPEENGVMAFSGSVVVDYTNTSGFGVNGIPPMVAVYTGAGTYQDQRLAFSRDSGLTWTNYANNPVINLYSNNFRDPKVIWHEASQKWIMVVSMGENLKIRFYSSPNLKEWTFMQDFGPLGNLSGVWECPDLFPLQVDDDPAKTKWVLVHSIGPGLEQYFIGDFDGSRFSWEKSEVTGTLIADFEGPDYQGWTLQGAAFGDKPAGGNLPGQQAVSGYLGNQLVNSFKNGDGSVGRLISPAFTIQKKFISFLIGGGNHPSGTYIKLVAGNKVIVSATGSNNEFLDWKSWDVGAYQGQEAQIIIVDSVATGWGHINVDHLIQSDTPVQTPNFGKVDFGKDFYASQSFFGMPGNRHVWLAWMSNWSYAGDVPTSPWRGIMTLPREVKLKTIDGAVKLVQSAVPETQTIENEIYSAQHKTASEVAAALHDVHQKTFRITAKTTPLHSGSIALKVRKSTNQETLIVFDVDRGEIRFDRSRSGAMTGNQIYSDIQVAPLKGRDGKVEFDLFVDNCSVELFSDQGQVVVSNLIFPDATSTEIELVAADTVLFESFEVREMKRIVPVILPVLNQPVARFSLDEKSGDAFIVDSISLKTFPVVNHYRNPERISGVIGNALRLDGHSTWAGSQNFSFGSITNKMAIEAWYATEAFSPREASIIHQSDPTSGFELSVSPFGEVIFSFFADHQKVTLKSVKRLLPYQWNHVVAQADLPRRQARIYVNGELWDSRDLQPLNQLNTSGSEIYIGRRSDEQSFDGYLLSVLNGALDELSVHNQVPSESEIKERYQKHAGKTTDLAIDAEARHGSDPLRPRFHPMPVTSWANENYGLIFDQGKYHMFFQKNPNFPSLYFMHWGHLSSTDLVNWKEEKIALRPSMEFDKVGTWSGSVIRDTQNEPVIYYTGVDGAKAGIGKAVPQDQELNRWEKPSANPVFSSPPGGYNHMDFRDPFLWKQEGSYYMIVGSGIQNQGGGLLFSYKSDDLIRWRAIDPVYQRTDVNKTGIFWEMPSLTKLNENDYLLCVTPVPMPGKKARAIYWVGSFQNDQFTPYDEEPRGFELMDGNLLSPAIGTDEHGNLVYSGILPESRNVQDQKNAGWRHTFSMVRSIRLLSDKRSLGHIPHPNLCRLRGPHTQVTNRQILQDVTNNLPEIRGNRKELDFTLNIGEASLFEIHLMKNANGGEVTKLVFNVDSSRIGFDRRLSTLSDAEKTLQEATYHFDRSRPLKVHLYMDHSTLEVFIDQLVVFSGRIYPSLPESDHSDLVVKKGTLGIVSLDAWELKRTGDEMGSEVCLPGELPDALFTHGQAIKKSGNSIFSAYPVPFSDNLHFSFQLERAGNVEFILYDIFGRKIVTLTPGFSTAGTHHQWVNTSGAAFRGIKTMIAQMMVDGTDAGRLKLIHNEQNP